MAPLQHKWEANSNAISRSPFLPAASEKREETTWQSANTSPEKMPHVTSSAAIAPCCTSAQRWGGQRKGEKHKKKQRSWIRSKGGKRNDTETSGFVEIDETTRRQKHLQGNELSEVSKEPTLYHGQREQPTEQKGGEGPRSFHRNKQLQYVATQHSSEIANPGFRKAASGGSNLL